MAMIMFFLSEYYTEIPYSSATDKEESDKEK